MAVPTRAEALSLLASTSPSPRLFQHVTVVAEVAAFLAHRATRAGVRVDRRLVEAAALLHDIDKALPADDPVQDLGHGAAGAAWLAEAGHAELARAITAHPVMRLDDAGAGHWVESAPIEDRIVSYADKRATQRVVSLEQRFARWQRKHPDYSEQLARALDMARRQESILCEALSIRPEQVERLRWVEDALARGRAAGTIPAASADLDGESPYASRSRAASRSRDPAAA